MIYCKRAYAAAETTDGYRLLVDRLWPRGIKKQDLVIDQWCKEIAPSTELRQWFHANPEQFAVFSQRYYAELDQHHTIWQPFLNIVKQGTLTLIYSAKDTEHNQALVLKAYLQQQLK